MPTPLPWHQIDTVLLDMDGTLIDLHFDSHLWQSINRAYGYVGNRVDCELSRVRVKGDCG